MISVFGNGQSRQHLNLNEFTTVKVGCNAIHRDFYVDHLVCVDRRMVQEALDSNCTSQIYTRQDWSHYFKNKPINFVPNLPYAGTLREDEPFQWGSGPYAVLLAATLDNDIHLYGFDLYSTTPYVNNIYKNTANYDPSTKSAIDPRYWVYQIAKVFEHFPDKYFSVYNFRDWVMPSQWRLANVNFKILD